MANKNNKNASPHKIPRWSISTDGGILVIFLVVGAIVAGGLICFYGSKEFEFTRADFLALGVVASACGLTLVVRWSANIRKIPRWFVSTETGRFLIFLFVEAIVVGAFFCFHSGEKKDLELTRTFILAMATVGGVYGLILAAIRSAKLSEQVKIGQKQAVTGQEQLFNQQLGQGATLLADKEKPIRRTGIRVLEDLAETTIGDPKQAQLIMRIIHDFVHEKTSPSLRNRKSLYTKIVEGRESLDIALGIRTLVSLYNESGKLVELEELVQFRNCRLEGLNFTDANLQGANFRYAKLQGVDFRNAELQGANFDGAELEWADCTDADFLDAKNLTQEQVKVMIFKVDQPPTLPKDLKKNLNKDLRYKWKPHRNNKSGRRRRYFVESKSKWSGKRVFKYLASIRDS